MLIIENLSINVHHHQTINVFSSSGKFHLYWFDIAKLNKNDKDWDRLEIALESKKYSRNGTLHSLNGPAFYSRHKGLLDDKIRCRKHWIYDGYYYEEHKMPNKNLRNYCRHIILNNIYFHKIYKSFKYKFNEKFNKEFTI